MHRLILLAGIVLLSFSSAVSAQWFSSDDNEDFLPVNDAFQASAWHDDDTLYVGFENAQGYYLYRHRFQIESRDDTALGDPVLPPGEAKTDEFLGDVNVFYDRVVIEVPLKSEAATPLPLRVTFQGCADAGLCYPPETIELDAGASSPPNQFADWTASGDNDASPLGSPDGEATVEGSRSLLSADERFHRILDETNPIWMLGLFFLAGLGLTFTPCVLPMVPILSSIIVGQNPTRPRACLLSLSYVAGMAATYALAGVLMGLFGAGLNVQARLQSPPVLITFALLFTLFALAMFGVFNLRLAPKLASRVEQWQQRAQRSGYLGLAAAGALSVLVVSPCVSAPLAGALVFISTTGNALMGGMALLALALGMGVPLVIVGTFGTTLMPRSGAWMNGVKAAFGVLLLGIAVWLASRLIPDSLSLLLWGTLATGSALALGALRFDTPQGWPRLRQTAGILLLIWGVALVLGAARGGNDPLRPLAPSSGEASQTATTGGDRRSTSDITTVTRLDELENALASAQNNGRPAFVDVTADWCISCQRMERNVYTDRRVADALSSFRRIQVDVTESNDDTRRILERFTLFGPPSLLFFAQGEEIRNARIQGEVDSDEFAAHLRQLLGWLDEQRS
nr:protein-disulfide reductase DsbD [Aidingimonas lacisalsi]